MKLHLRAVGMSLAIWDHTVTYHLTRVNTPLLIPARRAGTRFTYPRRDGRL